MKIRATAIALAVGLGIAPFFAGSVFAEDAAKDPGTPAAGAPMSTDEVKAQMESLVEKAIQVASGPLQNSDHFSPYGVVQTKDGQLQILRWGKPNPPPDLEIFRQINLAVRSETRKPEVMAAVTIAPTALPTQEGTQVRGIRAEVDHRYGAPLVVVVPYGRDNGKIVLGTLIYRTGRNPLFDHPESAVAVKPDDAPAAKPAADKPAAKPAAAKPAAKPKPAATK